MHAAPTFIAVCLGVVLGMGLMHWYTTEKFSSLFVPSDSTLEPYAMTMIGTVDEIGVDWMRVRAHSLYPDREFDYFLFKGTFMTQKSVPVRAGDEITVAVDRNKGELTANAVVLKHDL